MSSKDFIKLAISRTEKKYFPHFYTDDVEARHIYELFQKQVSEYYSTLLDLQKIKKVNPGDGVTTYCDFDDYLSACNVKKQVVTNFLLNFKKDYYKNKPIYSSKHDYLFKSITDYGLDLIDNFEKELNNLNTIDYKMTQEEEALLTQESSFSFKNPIRSFKEIKNGEKFKEIIGQETLMVIGQPSDIVLNTWVDLFCENAPIAMKSIGFDEKAISLNKKIYFHYQHTITLATENAFIEYDEHIKNDNIHYVSFDHTQENIASFILHEWAHGLDLEIGKALHNKIDFISVDFMKGDTILNKNHPLYEILKKGQEEMAWALGGTDYELYTENKKVAVKDYKEHMIEKIGKIICNDINSDWYSLSKEEQDKLKQIPEFKKLITAPLENLRNQEEKALRIVSKHIYAIFNSPIYKEIFPDVQHLTIKPRAKMLLCFAKDYSLEHNISWFNTKVKRKGHYENFALTDTDFSKFSSFRGMVNKKEYLFYPHEIFARRVQVLAMEPIVHEKAKKQENLNPVLQDRLVSQKSALFPEQSLIERAQIIDLVHKMAEKIGLKPNIKPAYVLEPHNKKCIQAQLKIEERGSLSADNQFIKKTKRLNKIEMKDTLNRIQQYKIRQENKIKKLKIA